jgi:protein gp37
MASANQWSQPLKWNKAAEREGRRRRVFCASMADVFDEDAPPGARAMLWDLIHVTPWLDWQLLTKRPENFVRYLPHDWGNGWPNVWLGTTIENQDMAIKRVPLLLQVPAAVRFLSCEPLLGPVDLTAIDACGEDPGYSALTCSGPEEGTLLTTIDWVIVGGESGHGARPMHPEWARSIRDQCQAAGVAFFFKQWGEWTPGENVDGQRKYKTMTYFAGSWSECSDDWATEQDEGPIIYRVGKKKAGRLLDGDEYNEFPQPPENQ